VASGCLTPEAILFGRLNPSDPVSREICNRGKFFRGREHNCEIQVTGPPAVWLSGSNESYSGFYVADVHEDTLLAEVLRQTVKQATGMSRAVFATIADEKSRHDSNAWVF